MIKQIKNKKVTCPMTKKEVHYHTCHQCPLSKGVNQVKSYVNCGY